MQYQEYPSQQDLNEFYPGGYQNLTGSIEPPEGRWKIPVLESMQPIFEIIVLGDTEVLLVLDVRSYEDSVYNRVYIDSNLNGDLTDDPPIDGKFAQSPERKNSCHVTFDTISTTIEVDGARVLYSFNLHLQVWDINNLVQKGLSGRDATSSMSMYIRTGCAYTGETELNGQLYRFIIDDSDCNGRFDDSFYFRDRDTSAFLTRLSPRGDRLYVGTDETFSIFDNQPLCNRLLLDGTLYDIDVKIAENKLTLTETSETLVPLNLSMDAERLTICSSDLTHGINIFRPGKQVMVPQDTYQLLSYQAYRTEKTGDLWRIYALGSSENSLVNADGTGESLLTFGEPYTPYVLVPPSSGRETQTRLVCFIKGSGGDIAVDIRRVTGDNTDIPLSGMTNYTDSPKEPAYRIVTSEGEVVQSGTFNYG